MTTVDLFFKDRSFLSIDLLHAFKRKWKYILDAKELLKNNKTNSGNLKVLKQEHDLEYILLFYFLNGAKIPPFYIEVFNSLPDAEKKSLLKYLNKKYEIKDSSIADLLTYSEDKRRAIELVVNNQRKNKGLSGIKGIFSYILDTIGDLRKRKGFIITFSGVDGAGKSTTIEHVKERISKKYRKKIVTLRHRPSLLPILSAYKYGKEGAEKRVADNLPRQGQNKSIAGSSLRFFYYYLDYLFGQFYVYFKYILRGYIVIYDRYYFDFINDAKRSNINLSPAFIKVMYGLIFKPRLNFFLYASPEIILSRKKELSKEAIVGLTEKYRSLFSAYNQKFNQSKYIQIENNNLNETLITIEEEFSALA